MAKLFTISLALLLCACSSRSNEAARPVKQATLFDSIQGIWWADTNDLAAAFWIDGDTIRTVDHFSNHPIRLEGDSLAILYDEEPWTNHVRMLGPDTVVMSGGPYEEPTRKYFKIKDDTQN